LTCRTTRPKQFSPWKRENGVFGPVRTTVGDEHLALLALILHPVQSGRGGDEVHPDTIGGAGHLRRVLLDPSGQLLPITVVHDERRGRTDIGSEPLGKRARCHRKQGRVTAANCGSELRPCPDVAAQKRLVRCRHLRDLNIARQDLLATRLTFLRDD